MANASIPSNAIWLIWLAAKIYAFADLQLAIFALNDQP